MQKLSDFLVPIKEETITINCDLGAKELEKSLKKVFEEMNNEQKI